ncbi:hypothetical protein JAAARDRAFT_460770 [Jaapia argillacea MUCL 33604]|uniref:Uncharacterized protein n=1 Tax=Jaapia argillacea MUCL 33604 TaxID=933084 RepID=A0A067Q613_9AGAM|nr:hypothetical protein JAAARDRAFT_460770 [Jaapia argillacea MUCL 33604]
MPLLSIQATCGDKIDASITCALASLALTLRVYLEGVPVPIVQNRVNAMGVRKFAVINAIPSWGMVLMSIWMIGRFIPYPFLTFVTAITAVVTSVCLRVIWTKIVNARASIVGSRGDASPV